MTEQNERIAVLETKVDIITDQVQEIDTKLGKMAENSTKQHKELADKISELDTKKAWLNGVLYIAGPVLMFIVTQIDWKHILK